MNDELKQIIEDIKLTLDVTVKDMVLLKRKDIEQLLDYITNLQEENKHLDEVNCHLRKKINNDIYKSRNEKAIKYIEEKADYPISYYHCLKELRAILQGSEKE